MRSFVATLALLLALIPGPAARGQSLDATSAEALSAAMKALLDPTQRAGAIAGNPSAGAADKDIRALTGSDALTQELYALAAQIFTELTVASGGDASKMSQTLEQARTDPAGFAATLSPQTRERLHQLSLKIQPR